MTCIVVTGIPASGKTTVAELLAQRLPNCVHLESDQFRKMVASARDDRFTLDEADPTTDLPRSLSTEAVNRCVIAGFNVVLEGSLLMGDLMATLDDIRERPIFLVVLAPRVEIVRLRSLARHLFQGGDTPAERSDAERLDADLRLGTPRFGLWIDSSELSVDETVDQILDRVWSEGRMDDADVSQMRDACLAGVAGGLHGADVARDDRSG